VVVGSALAIVDVDGPGGNNGDNRGPEFVGRVLSGGAGKKSPTAHTTQHCARWFEGAGCYARLAISEDGDITIVTKLAQSFGELLVRIEGEYREMPGLNLSLTQAERLWRLDRHTCASVLTTLVERRILTRTTSGTYLQRSSG
jgi:hypothetical protein